MQGGPLRSDERDSLSSRADDPDEKDPDGVAYESFTAGSASAPNNLLPFPQIWDDADGVEILGDSLSTFSQSRSDTQEVNDFDITKLDGEDSEREIMDSDMEDLSQRRLYSVIYDEKDGYDFTDTSVRSQELHLAHMIIHE